MTENVKVVSFPSIVTFTQRHAIRKAIFSALRSPARAVILDLSNRATLNLDDIDLLLDGAARVSGRDMRLIVVAGSRSNRVLLEVTRIASILTVFNTTAEALADPEAELTRQASACSSSDWSA